MSLKVELKPNERVIVGSSVITNGDARAKLYIAGRAPVLRERDILNSQTADTPAKRVYFAVQLMYLDDDVETLASDYLELASDLMRAAPSTISIVNEINNAVLRGELYKALRVARKLIQHEQDILTNAAAGRPSIPDYRQKDDQPA